MSGPFALSTTLFTQSSPYIRSRRDFRTSVISTAVCEHHSKRGDLLSTRQDTWVVRHLALLVVFGPHTHTHTPCRHNRVKVYPLSPWSLKPLKASDTACNLGASLIRCRRSTDHGNSHVSQQKARMWPRVRIQSCQSSASARGLRRVELQDQKRSAIERIDLGLSAHEKLSSQMHSGIDHNIIMCP